MALQASIPGPRRQPNLLTASVLGWGAGSSACGSARRGASALATWLSPVTSPPNSSVSSKDDAEGAKSASVSDKDGFAKPESALLESDSSELEETAEESELLELGVRGPRNLLTRARKSQSPQTQFPMTRTRMIQGPLIRPPAV